MSAERVVQGAVYAALTGDGAYMALVSGVHDGDAPKGTVYPYTVLGATTEVPDHTHDHDGYELTLTVHDWADEAAGGRRALLLIREARDGLLHNQILSVSGWGLTKMRYEFGEVVTDGDRDLGQHARHQVTRYRVRALSTS